MEEEKSVIKRGMDYAVPMAFYTTAIALMYLYIDRIPWLAYPMLLMLLGGPVVLYKMQRRYNESCSTKPGMWALWRLGVVTIFFGTIFTLLVNYAMLEYVRTDYIYEQMQTCVDSYSKVPEMRGSEFLAALESALKRNELPSSFDFSLVMFSFTNLSGMLMGLFTSSIAARK